MSVTLIAPTVAYSPEAPSTDCKYDGATISLVVGSFQIERYVYISFDEVIHIIQSTTTS